MKRGIKNFTPEQLREYNNEKKTRQRDREKAERAAKQVPTADDYEMPESQQQRLSEHARSVVKSIQLEAEVTDRDQWIIDSISRVMFGLENNVRQKVVDPSGMLVGGIFPDAVWAISVEHIHRSPTIMKSTTFADLYRRFLGQVVKWNNQTHAAYSSPELVEILNRELAGTYSPPPVPEPHKPPTVVESSENVPSDQEIRDRGVVQTLRQLGVPSDALHYLSGN